MTRVVDAMCATTLAIWTANLLAVTILPTVLGRSGIGVPQFGLYAAAAGLVLTMLEDSRNLQRLVRRPDLRAYLQVRIVLVALLAAGPYLAGRALAG